MQAAEPRVEPPRATRLSSSLRSRSIAQTLAIARGIAHERGVSRVTETTWLDRIGIPVFSSIRPDALEGSICVHAGKGFTADEAKIGAYMEAIEYTFAVEGRSAVAWHMASPAQVLDSFGGSLSFPDFCPRLSKKLSAQDRIAVVEADELLYPGLQRVLVPADLVFHPFVGNPGVRLYGTSTNGLASGNTVTEATVHALAEVMERDLRSFDYVQDRSRWVDMAQATPKIREMVRRVEAAGLRIVLRYTENVYGMPFFASYLMEADEYAPLPVAIGYGFHPIREISAIRALSEAVQSRGSYIHGGRDDLINRFNKAENEGRDEELRNVRRLRSLALDATAPLAYQDVPDMESRIATIEDAQSLMFEALRAAGLRHLERVVYTAQEFPIQVVRIIVPGAEFYEPDLRRVGPRLMKFFNQVRAAGATAP